MDNSTVLDEQLLNRKDIKTYQEITGAIMFAMTTCRPDLAHATNSLARRMSTPRVCDMLAAKRLLRYLRGTQRLGLLFRFEADSEHSGILAFADADWANDKEERRSTTGYIVMYKGTPIAWHSSLQSVIALSTCESDCIALSECCRELAYLRELAAFLHQSEDEPTPVYEDNEGIIDLVKNPVHHKRSKHVDVKFYYIRVAHEKGMIKVLKVHTDLNRADIMTKATTTTIFHRHVDAIMFQDDALP